MAKFAIYRVIDDGREYFSNPVKRAGKVKLFKNKKQAAKWLHEENLTTINKYQLRFEVRKWVKPCGS